MSKSSLEIFAKRLSQRAMLTDEDKAPIIALPHVRRVLNPHAYHVREGEMPRPCCGLVLSGLAFRHKLAADGRRQIVSIQLTGDLLDLQHLFLAVADHSVQALTELVVADIDRDALQEIALTRPAVGRALWVDGLIDASISREWVLNVGRRNGRARIAHILCEIAVRMRAAGILNSPSFRLPMTQEQLGDATG
ncbi:Crp/Fnr family transcriptional regulator [Sphingomonas phyllosphaerae]|uniref:Crp/Fnr family transcriptional regulator n=1 Tax=Sphingomonas phyllosphaerae TaxID=257003 RepID=UPI001E5BF9F2|nr:Crp/Fnr family transcriptional regulator [Sphingomonas phyllosphaerae]